MRCFILTIAFFHLSIRILQCCTSQCFFIRLILFLFPFRMPSKADSLKWFTPKIRGKEF